MLSKRDLLQAFECVRAITEAGDHEQFVASLVREMHRLTRAKVTGYNEADPARKRFTFVIHPREVVSDAIIAAWVRHAHENPLIRHVQQHPGDFTVHKITDFVPQDQFRKTALCRTTYREMGAEYQIAMPFPVPGSAAIAIVFNRAHDFGERERELLTLLQPLVFAAYRNVQKITDLQLAEQERPRAVGPARLSDRSALAKFALSRRETDVFRQLIRGKTNKQIAARLKLSARTIEKHVEHLLRKLKVRTRAAACAKFQR